MTRTEWFRVALALSLLCRASLAVAADDGGQRQPPPISTSVKDPPLFGDKDGLLYFRDPLDYVRLYPHARVSGDAQAFLGSRVASISKDSAGADLGTRFLLREARLGLGGELLQRLAFSAALDLVANPAVDGAKVGNSKQVVALSETWLEIDNGRGFSLTMGYYQAPFSLENRTERSDLSMMERNLAIRGFVVPGGKVLGASIGGIGLHDVARWDVGIFGAESFAPGELQRSFQTIARARVLPLAWDTTSALRELQFGMSFRVGARNRRDANDDIPAINTGQGFSLFRPTYTEGGRTIHIIPDGAQAAIGGEFRLPFHDVVLTSEAYWLARHTEEGPIERPDQVERSGSIDGWGWYVQLSAWVLQALGVIDGQPQVCGEYPHAEHLEVAQIAPKVGRYGIEAVLIAAGINGNYAASSRGGAPSMNPATNLEAYQFGLGLNYWQTVRFRLSASGNLYAVPRAGTLGNLLVVPGNLAAPPDRGAETLWEVGARATFMF